MIKRFISTLKENNAARYALIAILILMVPLCILGVAIGIPIFVVVIFMLAIAFPAVLAAGAIGAAAGLSRSFKSNKGKLDKTIEEAPEFADMERERGKLQTLNVGFWIVAIVVVLLSSTLGGVGIVLSVAAAIAAYFFFIFKRNKAFTDSFKQRIVLAELQRAFDNVTFEPGKTFDKDEMVRASPIGFDNCGGDDWIEGDRKGLHFCRSDIYLNVEVTTTDEDGHSTTSDSRVFTGAMVRMQTQRPFDGDICVTTKSLPHRMTDNVDTESIEFERRMSVYADDQITARRLLTPQVMESLLQLEDACKESFSLVYTGSYVYAFIASPEGNSFEVNLKKDTSIIELRSMVEEQVARICVFLDNLKLPNVES